MQNSHHATNLLQNWNAGDGEALSDLFPLVYNKLHSLAGRLMSGERKNHTLQTTALVHEVYLALVDTNQITWRDRGHFYALAARLMRRILVDHARAGETNRRGGGIQKLSLEGINPPDDKKPLGLVALDEALDHLASFDARKARIIELRYFGGLSVEETAETLNVSKPTVILDTRLAKAWLFELIYGETGDGQ